MAELFPQSSGWSVRCRQTGETGTDENVARGQNRMLKAALDNVHEALMGFAVQHDVLFSLLLVAPAAVAYFFAYLIVRYRVRPARAFVHGLTAVSTGLFVVFLTASDQSALPRLLRALSFDATCAAIPLIMLVLGACWGVFVASLMAWWRTRPVAH
ncbi:hypothetical protein GCT13_38105 [Paraburkholderia sp. CNPSo 3157]|uniref:Uncharacterized protein n=1 Tax=Paraburkholderia franconis TaxID=2654983 RepID=A0A7X1TKJ7_9BURK|nr:hypothetical protein [Paraburkholderia franconis]MPW22483.1 hypothetical protein [Paraburkholderia franconis]